MRPRASERDPTLTRQRRASRAPRAVRTTPSGVLRSTVVALLVLAGSLAGCAEDEGSGAPPASAGADSAPAATAASAASAAAPSVQASADKTHAVQPGDEINLTVSVHDFRLDGSAAGQANEPGVGHYHVYLGSTASEPLLVSGEQNTVLRIPDDVNDGTHSLRIVLYNNDHSPVDPPVQATLRLIVYRLD